MSLKFEWQIWAYISYPLGSSVPRWDYQRPLRRLRVYPQQTWIIELIRCGTQIFDGTSNLPYSNNKQKKYLVIYRVIRSLIGDSGKHTPVIGCVASNTKLKLQIHFHNIVQGHVKALASKLNRPGWAMNCVSRSPKGFNFGFFGTVRIALFLLLSDFSILHRGRPISCVWKIRSVPAAHSTFLPWLRIHPHSSFLRNTNG